ncbi:CHAT domain-containing protein [Phormidium sp. LEGE 05292]|nr:CHAT domain-containing protein [Phormidium sp. LEGE 05292]
MLWHRRQTIKIILAFLGAFSIACGLISVPAFPQFVPSQANPQVLIEQSRKLYDVGQFTEAVTILQQVAELFRAKGDKVGEAIALSNLSVSYKQLGQLETAYSYITASLKLLNNSERATHRYVNKTENSELVLAQILDIQGNLQLELAKAQPALESWKQADNIYHRIGDRIGQIRSQINIAQAQQALGMYRQARITLEQVNQTLATQPDSITKATALRSLGDVLQLIGDLDNSLKLLQQSKDIAENLKSPTEISATLLSLGNTQVALGNRSRTTSDNIIAEKYTPLNCTNKFPSAGAQKFYQQAAQFYEQAAANSTSSLAQVQAQLNHLSVLIQLNKWLEAQNLSAEIKSKLSKTPLSHAAISAQINFAQNLVCFKQATADDVPTWQEIAQYFGVAIEQSKSIDDRRLEAYALGALGGLYLETQNLNQAEEITQKALLLAQEIKAEYIAYLWQWQLGYILKSQGDVRSAIASYTEAVNTLKSLRSDLVALNPDVQFSFRDNVEPVYRQLVDLLLKPLTGGTQGEVNQKNLKQARDVIEALQLSELENFFREACLQAKPQQIDEIVDKTDPTSAVIYPIILPDRLEIILKLPTDSELHNFTTYKPQSEIESNLEKLQQYLREPDRINDVKKLSEQVYNWLIEPLATELEKKQIKTLVFVLDGYLRNVPMAVLYDNKQQKYLIQKYAIAVAPGLQLVESKSLQRGKLYALIGGVSEERQIEGKSFTPLENVNQELQEIKSEVPRSQQLVNQNFTESDLKNRINSVPFSVVHLATHGQFSSNANDTFILTWKELLKAKDFDNLLRLRDSSESSSIELLVLSACQTAAGDRRAALGLAGIAVRAGARSTLATLWSVDDRSTAELMSQFYQELANAQVSKAEALRRAQLTLLANYEIPYFWAPYVLVGNWL